MPPISASPAPPPVADPPAGLPVVVPTDGELLNQFTRHGDAEALAAVVDRHAALVWTVCSRLLAQPADAEDAFQATMLILAKKATAVRANDSAGGWLFRVAYHTALLAKRRRKRRRETELVDAPLAPEQEFPNIEQRQITAVLMEELRGLPAKYQTPLVLRYLEGKSRRQIADATDATVAKVAGQLVRGKRLLRSRLARRGVSLAVAMAAFTGAKAATAGAASPAPISPPPPFDPGLTATAASAAVSSLVNQGVRSMLMASLAKPAAVGAACVVVALALLVEGDALGKAPPADAGSSRDGVVLDATAPAEPTLQAPPVAIARPSEPTESRRRQPPEQPGKKNRVIAPTITTPNGQPATIGVESPSGKTELTVTPTIKGDTVEIAAEVVQTASVAAGSPEAMARLKEQYRRATFPSTSGSLGTPSFEELFHQLHYWDMRQLATEGKLFWLKKEIKDGTRKVPGYEVNELIGEIALVKSKQLEIERLMKQAALRETGGLAEPSVPAGNNAPLPAKPPAATTDATIEEIKLLKELVKLKEHTLQAIELRYRQGEATLDKASAAAADLTATRIELAEAEGKTDEAVQHMETHVAHFEAQLSQTERQVKLGEAPAIDLVRAKRALIDAKLRLAREKARPNAVPAAGLRRQAPVESVIKPSIVSDGSEVHVVGTYSRGKGSPLTVRVEKTDKPLTLVLTSYFWQNWRLDLAEGVKLNRVIVAGYNKQRIDDLINDLPERTKLDVYTYFPTRLARQDSPRPAEFGDRESFWAYQENDEYFFDMVERLKQLTGSDIASFQGEYTAKSFLIK